MMIGKGVACALLAVTVALTAGCNAKSVSSAIGKLAKNKAVREQVADIAVDVAIDQATGSRRQSAGAGSGRSPGVPAKSGMGKAGVIAGATAGAAGAAAASAMASSTDLSLGPVCIGQTRDDVYSQIGREYDITDPNKSGHLRYQYRDLEVVITNGIVTGFVSNTSRFSTARGVSQGDSLQKVLNLYGAPYAQSEYDGTMLYEYRLTSLDGRQCLLRFAIKNGAVDYISARLM